MITDTENRYLDKKTSNLKVKDEMMTFGLREKLKDRQHTILQGIDLINQGYPENDTNEYMNDYYLISSILHDLNSWKFIRKV